jgi:hypothetical protein
MNGKIAAYLYNRFALKPLDALRSQPGCHSRDSWIVKKLDQLSCFLRADTGKQAPAHRLFVA